MCGGVGVGNQDACWGPKGDATRASPSRLCGSRATRRGAARELLYENKLIAREGVFSALPFSTLRAERPEARLLPLSGEDAGGGGIERR